MSSRLRRCDDDMRRKDEESHRYSRRGSRSSSRSRRYREDLDRRSRSRSRSRSLDRYRRRSTRRSRSRSRSASYKSSSYYNSSRRFGNSRSRSRSKSSHRSSKPSRSRHSTSLSPKRSSEQHDSKKSSSRSPEHNDIKKGSKDDEKISCTQNSESLKSLVEDNNSSQYFSCTTDADTLENLPLPDQTETNSNSYEFIDDSQEPIDKERIHREMEEKLRLALAKEGKVYPPPKPEASHPVFANDGSFLEIFKKMQEAQQTMSATSTTVPAFGISAPSTSTAAAVGYTAPCPPVKSTAPPPPLVGRRRGGKILKTGVVAKPKATNSGGDDKDFWSLYLAEVNKYKNNTCELNSGNRPLLK